MQRTAGKMRARARSCGVCRSTARGAARCAARGSRTVCSRHDDLNQKIARGCRRQRQGSGERRRGMARPPYKKSGSTGVAASRSARQCMPRRVEWHVKQIMRSVRVRGVMCAVAGCRAVACGRVRVNVCAGACACKMCSVCVAGARAYSARAVGSNIVV